MQGENARKFRRRGGFTFTEVLVTLAILGVLLAVAIPATISLTKGLKMMELDSCARQIAVVAQNNLVGVKSAGQLQLLSVGQPPSGGAPSVRRLSNGEPGAEKLLPTGAIDPAVAGKYYTIVYNSATGTVLEVYYAEAQFDVSNALTNLSGMETAKVEARKAAKIGYYSGADIQSAPVGTLPKPVVTVENGENLVVRVTTTPMNWQSTARLTLHVAKEDGTGEALFSLPAISENSKLLDSLSIDESNRFRSLIGGESTIIPGDNLKIWATLDPIEPEKYLSATSNIEYTNSLFGSYDMAKNKVTIENARHLQNLDKRYSGVSMSKNFHAIQTADVGWPGGLTFIPINNDLLTGYNGGTNLISGLKVAVDTSAGLFESFSGKQDNKIDLTGIRLVNPSIIANGKDAGALVGTAENVEITDCFAYAEKVDGKWPVAQISGGTAGGLIGSATNCSISYSGAAMPAVTGTTAAGGLIGEAKGETEIESCYAATDRLQATDTVAGFIGSADGKDFEVENCYAVGNIAQDAKNVSGFSNGKLECEDSYCAMTYLDADGNPLGLEKIHGFGHPGGGYESCAYLTPVGAAASNGGQNKVREVSYAELTSASGTKLSVSQSHPYRDDLQGKAYPFPALKMEKVSTSAQAKMPHYGSWPAVPAPKGEVLLAYYEKYNDNTTGFYYLDKDGKVINTLDNKNEKIITDTQYGILFEGKSDTAQFDVQVDGIKLEYGGPYNVEVHGKQYEFYPFSSKDLKKITADAATVLVGSGDKGKTYQMYPRFAAGIAHKGTILGNEALPLQVRTQPQLEEVARYKNQDDSYFGQTHNISISGQWQPIEMRTKRTYDGGGNNITELTRPLFAAVQSGSTVKNVVIEQAQVAADHGDGIFARSNSGAITSCSVRNSGIGFIDDGWDKSAAGFVGTNSGTIALCSAVADVTSTNGTAAGFAGTNKGTIQTSYANCAVYGAMGAGGFVNENGGTIQSCYAMGSATANYGTAAGFVIRSYEKQGISKCYAAVIVNTDEKKNAFGFAPQHIKTTECYYIPYGNVTKNVDEEINYIQAVGTYLIEKLGTDWEKRMTGCPFPMLQDNTHYGDWPQTLPNKVGDAIGVFYYEIQADGNYLIDAAAISYTSTDNAIVISEKSFIPNFLTGRFNVEKDTEWGTSGLGQFYSSNLVFTSDFLHLKYAIDSKEYNKTSPFPYPDNATQKLGDWYYFKPVLNLQKAGQKVPYVSLWYYYGNNSNWNWQYNFQYNTTDKAWTITK